MITKEQAQMLTHVNVAFGVLDEKGLLSLGGVPRLGEQAARLKAYNPHIRLVLSIGGWGAGGFSKMSAAKAGRDAFAASVLAAVSSLRLDGADIDWEYPCSGSAGIDYSPDDRENFTLLLEALRSALGENRILSIAAGGGAYFIRDTQMDRVQALCDYVQLMTYDLRSGFCRQAGHHAAAYPAPGDEGKNAQEITRMFIGAGVPAEKLVIGAAFYARHWEGVPAEDNGLFHQAGSLGLGGPDYGVIRQKYLTPGSPFTRYFDENAKAPYLFDGSTFISYDDPQSLSAKCQLVKEMKLLGIMYWEHSCDPTGELLKALFEADS